MCKALLLQGCILHARIRSFFALLSLLTASSNPGNCTWEFQTCIFAQWQNVMGCKGTPVTTGWKRMPDHTSPRGHILNEFFAQHKCDGPPKYMYAISWKKPWKPEQSYAPDLIQSKDDSHLWFCIYYVRIHRKDTLPRLSSGLSVFIRGHHHQAALKITKPSFVSYSCYYKVRSWGKLRDVGKHINYSSVKVNKFCYGITCRNSKTCCLKCRSWVKQTALRVYPLHLAAARGEHWKK